MCERLPWLNGRGQVQGLLSVTSSQRLSCASAPYKHQHTYDVCFSPEFFLLAEVMTSWADTKIQSEHSQGQWRRGQRLEENTPKSDVLLRLHSSFLCCVWLNQEIEKNTFLKRFSCKLSGKLFWQIFINVFTKNFGSTFKNEKFS